MAVLAVQALVGPVACNITGNFPLLITLGNTKDVVLTYIGYALFDDAKFSLQVAAGLFINFLGCGYYMYDSYSKS